jgi:hypothetical protein
VHFDTIQRDNTVVCARIRRRHRPEVVGAALNDVLKLGAVEDRNPFWVIAAAAK